MHPIGLSLFTFADATHTPHGDDNFPIRGIITHLELDATHTPHGDDNKKCYTEINRWGDATHIPHGDGKHKALRLCAKAHGLRVLYFI